MIDTGLIVGDIFFQERHDRMLYINTSNVDRKQWLEEHKGTWRHVADVQRELAAMAAPPDSESAAPRVTDAKDDEPMQAPVASEIFVEPRRNVQDLQPQPDASIPADRQLARTATKGQPAITTADTSIEEQPIQGLQTIGAPETVIEQDTSEPGAMDLLHMLAPEGPWTVRSISSIDGGAPKPPRGLGYHVGPNNEADHENGLHGWIGAAEAGKLNCYVHAAVGPDDKSKLSKNEVISAHAVWTDVDPGDEENLITSNADFVERRAKILAAMRAEDPPFSCIVDSGNGFQAYKFTQPFRIDGKPDGLSALEAANKAVNESMNQRLTSTGLKADKCHSADHLMRLPGTTNFLTAKKRSHGYPEGDRPARIIDWHPERVYKLEELPAVKLEKKNASGDRGTDQQDDGGARITPDQLKVLLSGLDPKNFRDGPRWRSLLWAAHQGTGGAGCEVFVEWSASDSQFAGEQEHTRATWDRAKDDRENGNTIATLFHELKEAGRDDLVQQVQPDRHKRQAKKWLEIGSDVEMAQLVHKDLFERFDPIVYAEGAFWPHSGTHWEPIAAHELRCTVHVYDGALFGSGNDVSAQRCVPS